MIDFRVVRNSELPMLYAAMEAENILWAMWPEHGMTCTEEEFCAAMGREDVLVLLGRVDGDAAGVLTLTPFCSDRTRCGEVGLCGRRKYFSMAAMLCRSALLWCYDNLELRSMVGRVPCPNRHILRMLEAVGFSRAAKLEGLVWYERQQKFVDGWLVTATRESIERSMT